MADSATSPLSLSTAITRGAFLACSWTWCIGMFFPVYLIKDFGWPGWVVFAIPNCIGAWAVGWWWRKPGSSEKFVAENLVAMRWFSIVTIVFQLCFLGWFQAGLAAAGPPGSGGEPSGWTEGMLPLGSAIVGAVIGSRRGSQWWGWAGVACVFVSLLGMIGAYLGRASIYPAFELPRGAGRYGLPELAKAAPAIVMGFLLCPHLDLTFHRTCRECSGRWGIMAFSISFFLIFPFLVLFTLFYAGPVLRGMVSVGVVFHIVVQLSFTMGAHLRELRERGFFVRNEAPPAVRKATFFLGVTVAAVLLVLSIKLGRDWHTDPGARVHRITYELFMSMYGLVFPAYIWIVSIPRGIPFMPRLAGWICSLLLAAPCFWFGYIEQRFAWLPVGVGVVLLMPWAVRGIALKKA